MEEDDGTYTAALRNGTWKFVWGSPGDNNDWYATDGSVTEAADDDGTATAAAGCTGAKTQLADSKVVKKWAAAVGGASAAATFSQPIDRKYQRDYEKH